MYLRRVLNATTPSKSSAVVAAELGVTAAFVRVAWRRAKLPKREAGYRRGIDAGKGVADGE